MTTDTQQTNEDKSTETTGAEGEPTEQEQQEASEGFARGFAKARGEEEPKPEQTDPETGGEPAKAGETPTGTAAAAPAATAPAPQPQDPWAGVPAVVRAKLESLSSVQGQIRNLAGHIGGINSKLETVLATAKAAATDKGGAGAAPSDKQVAAAMANPDAWKKLKEDYPDWAEPLEHELNAMRAEIQKATQAATANKGQPPVDLNKIRAEVTRGVGDQLSAGLDAAEERAFVRLKHPDWKQTVATPEFRAWTLEGGPTAEMHTQMKQLERVNPARAEAVVNQWARDYPQWWADRGAAIFDERADAAINLLDKFKSHREQALSQDAKRQRSQQRLERSVPARSAGGAPVSTGISDTEAWKRGFNRGLGKR